MKEGPELDKYAQLTDAKLEDNSEIHLDYPSETLHRIGTKEYEFTHKQLGQIYNAISEKTTNMRRALGGYEEETLEEFAEIYNPSKSIKQTALEARENAIESAGIQSTGKPRAADLLEDGDGPE